MDPRKGETWRERATGKVMVVHSVVTMTHEKNAHQSHVTLCPIGTDKPTRHIFTDVFLRDWSHAPNVGEGAE